MNRLIIIQIKIIKYTTQEAIIFPLILKVLNSKLIMYGKTDNTIPKTIVRSTDKLCFTTFVSSSKSNLGCHKLINSPPKAKIKFISVGTTKMASDAKSDNFNDMQSIVPPTIMQGSKMDKCTKILEINNVFSFIGEDFKSQIFLPSNEIELAEIGAVASIKP